MQMRWRCAAGELVREARQRLTVEADEPHQVLGARDSVLLAHAEIDRALDDGIADGAARIERAIRILEHDLHALAMRTQRMRFDSRATSVPSIRIAPSLGSISRADAARHRRLARAGLADNAERLAAAHAQRSHH